MQFVYVTVSSMDEARKISKHLLEKKLIACANIFPISSIYRWESEIKEDPEYAIILKTVPENFKTIEKTILSIHTYDTPCIVSWDIKDASVPFFKWVEGAVR